MSRQRKPKHQNKQEKTHLEDEHYVSLSCTGLNKALESNIYRRRLSVLILTEVDYRGEIVLIYKMTETCWDMPIVSCTYQVISVIIIMHVILLWLLCTYPATTPAPFSLGPRVCSLRLHEETLAEIRHETPKGILSQFQALTLKSMPFSNH